MAGNGVNVDNVQPETSTTYEGGYRYQTSAIIGSVALWESEYHNRIVSTYNPDTDITQDRNVGTVQFYGLDAQLGAKPMDHMTAVATFSYEHSKVLDNVVFDAKGDIEPIAGKELVETPDIQIGGRVTYALGDATLGIQGKYVGSRYTTDLNDQKVAGYTTFDLDLRYSLDRWTAKTYFKGTYVQLNVQNLFDYRYYGSLGTEPTNNQASPFYSGAPYAYQGAPRTIVVKFNAAF